MIEQKKIIELKKYYKKHLLDDVIAFWEPRTKDSEYGGYITCFDRVGNITDKNKYIWFQGRNLWMFSKLYNSVEHKEQWLELAACGRDFLVKHAYAGNGRWNYTLDQKGEVTVGTTSIFSDMFVVAGLAEYAIANGSDDDFKLIKNTYDAIVENTYDLEFKDIYHNRWDPKYKRHGIYMINLISTPIVGEVLGVDYVKPLMDHCLEQVLYVFAKDEQKALLEAVGRDGKFIDEPEGRMTYPGHTMEACWACIEEGIRRNDKSIIDRAIEIANWGYNWGYDNEFGGIVSYRDIKSEQPLQADWNREVNMQWYDKNFWVNAEALYTLALVALLRNDESDYNKFYQQHSWCKSYFYDPEYGEWYAEVNRDGSVKNSDKGTIWKSAFHVPRALLLTYQAMENFLTGAYSEF
jgi:N-acylglucosamine 2-epimerase